MVTTMTRPGTALAGLGIFVSVGGCQEDLPEQRISGEYVHVYKAEDAEFCAGSLAYMDAHVEAMAAMFGLDLPSIDFFWVGHEDVPKFCRPGARACYQYREERIISSYVPDTHELVHAMHGANGLRLDQFLGEGLAYLFEENLPWEERDLAGSIEELLSFADPSSNLPATLLGRAAHFAWFLLDRYGAGPVDLLTRRRLAGRSIEAQDQVMLEVTGETLAEALAAYKEVPECPLAEFRAALVECSAPLVPWDAAPAQTWSSVVTLGCERDDVLGPVSGVMWTTRAFEVEAGGEYQVSALGAGLDTALVVVARCGSRCGDAFYQVLRPGESRVFDLKPGRYYTMLVRHVEDPGEIGLSVLGVH